MVRFAFHHLLHHIITFLLISASLVGITCSTGPLSSKVSFYFLKPFSSFFLLNLFVLVDRWFVSSSAVGWLSATAREICHSVTALNLDRVGGRVAHSAADVTRPAPAAAFTRELVLPQSQASLLTTQLNSALSLSLLSHTLETFFFNHIYSLDGCLVLETSWWWGEGGRPGWRLRRLQETGVVGKVGHRHPPPSS